MLPLIVRTGLHARTRYGQNLDSSSVTSRAPPKNWRMKNPKSGVRSIVPIRGGTSPENSLRYGSVTCRSANHGCSSHFVNVGNQLNSTRTNSRSRYNLMNEATALVMIRNVGVLPETAANGTTIASILMPRMLSLIWPLIAAASDSDTLESCAALAEKALETLSTLRPTSERSEWEAGWDEEGMDDVALTETRGQRLVRDKFDRGAFAFAATFWHSDFIMPFTVSYSGYVHTTGGVGLDDKLSLLASRTSAERHFFCSSSRPLSSELPPPGCDSDTDSSSFRALCVLLYPSDRAPPNDPLAIGIDRSNGFSFAKRRGQSLHRRQRRRRQQQEGASPSQRATSTT